MSNYVKQYKLYKQKVNKMYVSRGSERKKLVLDFCDLLIRYRKFTGEWKTDINGNLIKNDGSFVGMRGER